MRRVAARLSRLANRHEHKYERIPLLLGRAVSGRMRVASSPRPQTPRDWKRSDQTVTCDRVVRAEFHRDPGVRRRGFRVGGDGVGEHHEDDVVV